MQNADKHQEELNWLLGGEAEFALLYQRYYPVLCGIAFNYVRSSEHAADIVQDLFTHLWSIRHRTRPDSVSAYLFTMVRNRSIDHLRREKKFPDTNEPVESPDDRLADQDIEARQTGKKLNELIRGLSPQCRTVFVLVRFHRLKYREVAELLGISEKTVENHMGRALKILRDGMGQERDGTTLMLLFLIDFQEYMNFSEIALGVS